MQFRSTLFRVFRRNMRAPCADVCGSDGHQPQVGRERTNRWNVPYLVGGPAALGDRFLLDKTVFKYEQRVGQTSGFTDTVCYVQCSDAGMPAHPVDYIIHLATCRVIQGTQRFVQQQHRRVE